MPIRWACELYVAQDGIDVLVAATCSCRPITSIRYRRIDEPLSSSAGEWLDRRCGTYSGARRRLITSGLPRGWCLMSPRTGSGSPAQVANPRGHHVAQQPLLEEVADGPRT